ncbi:MAG: tetratricopeptide repeat protein, partial [Pelagibacterales bacterium]|nr:tetratricopeptide repeat protein [Pelagibacterales bacterium]
MKKLLFLLFFISFYGNAQQQASFLEQELGRKLCESYTMNFSSETEADNAVQEILSTIGASNRFVVQSCDNISMAAAILVGGIRYIFYNRNFMNKINSHTNYWSNMSILAHEIGHHINQHTVDALLNKNQHIPKSLAKQRIQELEADEFAGFVLAKLGATLTQGFEAIGLISSDKDDTYSTHPSRSKRFAAFSKGFNKALGKESVVYTPTKSEIAEEYFYSALAKITNGDYYGAIAGYNKAIELNPNFAIAYVNRGYSKMNLKDYNGAIADFTKAIEIDHNDVKAYENRGYSKNRLEDYYGA